MIIAIDGPAASGKSTAARALAAQLGFVFLDTGAMYRAVTHEVLAQGLEPGDEAGCALVAGHLRFDLGQGGRLLVLSDGVEVADAALRTAEVTRNVSEVAAHSTVRRVLVAHQQGLGRRARTVGGGVVAEGRDTTTVVFPDAEHKFFLVASPAERARRRALEEARRAAPGAATDVSVAALDPAHVTEIQRDIERRDTYDSTRADSPLRQHPDAVALVTDGLDAAAVVAALVEVVQPTLAGGAQTLGPGGARA
ncbi:MAG: (d)CMP kinase [Planctomycetota bacterium]